MAHGDAREGKWRGNCWMEWVASTLHTTSEHGLSSITAADAHTSAARSRTKWRPHRFKWTRPFRRKTKSGFCACAITFKTQSSSGYFTVVFSQTQLLRFLGAAAAAPQLSVAARLETIHLLAGTSGVKNHLCLPASGNWCGCCAELQPLDTTHFAELRRTFKSSLRYRRLVPNEFFCKSGRVGSFTVENDPSTVWDSQNRDVLRVR